MRSRPVVLLLTATLALGVAALPAQATQREPSARTVAASPVHSTRVLPTYLKNLIMRWANKPPAKLARTVAKGVLIKKATAYIASGGTDCSGITPDRFCSSRVDDGRLGLGQAMLSTDGRRPGVWDRTYSRQYEVAQPLVPGQVYYLSCWLLGDRVVGPYGSTDLWYRLWGSGYVSDALLYTGTNYQIPGVRRC